MICTLFTGQTGKEGIFMKYSYEFKMNAHSCTEKEKGQIHLKELKKKYSMIQSDNGLS